MAKYIRSRLAGDAVSVRLCWQTNMRVYKHSLDESIRDVFNAHDVLIRHGFGNQHSDFVTFDGENLKLYDADELDKTFRERGFKDGSEVWICINQVAKNVSAHCSRWTRLEKKNGC